jgi:hypothetical protein
VNALDLTDQEQAHVRAALHFLRNRCGGWGPLGKVLRLKHRTLSRVAVERPVTPTVAFRVARLARVSVDDVLAGRFPAPGTCSHCGHVNAPEGAEGRAES